MRFGFFDQLPRADWQSESQRYQDILAQIELGDELGFDTAWLGELHFIPSFSCLASPLMILAAAAQRTKRIRLGTAVTLLPLHNPKLGVSEAGDAILVDYQGTPRYRFPRGDCALLAIPNTTVEMLAQYFVGRVKAELGTHASRLSSIEIEVEESIGQSAFYRERM